MEGSENDMKNVLIIGGSGGLSSVLAQMASKNSRVWTVTRGKRQLPDGVVSLKVDRNNTDELKKILKEQNTKWDVVFDCICMNLEQARADIDILPEFSKRLVVVSTDSVYDSRAKKIPEDEYGICVHESGSTKDCTYAGNKRRMEECFLKEMESMHPALDITIFRPGHIYGPGFLLGCFPEHSRQAELPELILKGKPIRLVGAGTYIIQPIYVDDLARVMLDSAFNEKTYGELFCIGGPDAIENRIYYKVIANCLGVDLKLEEIPVLGYVEAHPEYSGHLCHRIYDLSKLKSTGIRLPDTRIVEGIKRQLASLGYLDKIWAHI